MSKITWILKVKVDCSHHRYLTWTDPFSSPGNQKDLLFSFQCRLTVIYINLNVITAQELQQAVRLMTSWHSQIMHMLKWPINSYFLIYIQYTYLSLLTLNTYQLITSKKISYSTTLQYCIMPNRFKKKHKPSFCGKSQINFSWQELCGLSPNWK